MRFYQVLGGCLSNRYLYVRVLGGFIGSGLGWLRIEMCMYWVQGSELIDKAWRGA